MNTEQRSFLDQLIADPTKDNNDVYVDYICRYGTEDNHFYDMLDVLNKRK